MCTATACGGGNEPAIVAPHASAPAADRAPAPASSPPSTTLLPEATVTTAAEVTATPQPAVSTLPPAETSIPSTLPAISHRSVTLDQLQVRPTIAPVHLRVEGIAIDAPVAPVGAAAGTGELAIPPRHDLIGWYQHGPSPGDPGSAVLAAHVDWHGHLGAFFELNDVAVGAIVVVTLADEREISFTVTSTEQIPKTELVAHDVFRPDGEPQLVLITCGGVFNRETRHYTDNIVVFARPI